MENYLGFGLNVRLSENVFMTPKAGVGMVNFQNIDPRQVGFKNNSTWDFGYMLSFGVMYRLKEKIKK
ncbi:MAG: hypothetical protein L3J06_05375 [Cyclobacteriaceae bacterium]|nr:hypothetical protein [Cyclobacteriaceae bacterium]